MEESQNSRKVKVIIIVACAVLIVLALVIIMTSEGVENNVEGNGGVISGTDLPDGGNSQTVNKEKDVDISEAQKFFEMIPYIYNEEDAPFSDVFMLEAAMSLVTKEEEPDYSAAHVDAVVQKLFGSDAKINKDNVKEMDIQKSLYYYYPDTDTYYVIPVGTEFQYRTQLLNKVTRDDNYVYIYTNEVDGVWHYEEENIVVVIGDKAGNDLVKRFENYDDYKNFDAWQTEYKDKLPILKYTLKKVEDNYIVIGLEKVNY